ncbi:hypothetical protein [Caballeronia sp. J97]|uniref:hypothetical protein n=1 Tax=Caballeronia sp. J97 TaxID=2805429 RepID=UPI002AB19D86|nr:hypothetical protein [Caballeronia sp. J97]
MKIVDSDASVYVNFVIQTREGPRYCAQMDARRRRNRNALLRMALESGRTVMLISGINSYVRTAVIGMDPHMLASDSGLH